LSIVIIYSYQEYWLIPDDTKELSSVLETIEPFFIDYFEKPKDKNDHRLTVEQIAKQYFEKQKGNFVKREYLTVNNNTVKVAIYSPITSNYALPIQYSENIEMFDNGEKITAYNGYPQCIIELKPGKHYITAIRQTNPKVYWFFYTGLFLLLGSFIYKIKLFFNRSKCFCSTK
jgi:hypothetical protein